MFGTTDDLIKESSNFGMFMEHFSSDNDSWIQEINNVIEN